MLKWTDVEGSFWWPARGLCQSAMQIKAAHWQQWLLFSKPSKASCRNARLVLGNANYVLGAFFCPTITRIRGQVKSLWTGELCFLVFPLLPHSSACSCQHFYWTVLQRLGVSDAISSYLPSWPQPQSLNKQRMESSQLSIYLLLFLLAEVNGQ